LSHTLLSALRRPIQQNGKNRNDTNASWVQTLASPLGEEGHEVAKGCWRVRIGKKLKVEQAAYRRSRPQWSVTSALDLVHPMAPQGATRVGGRKSLRHTLLIPFRRHPLWWLAPPPCPVGSVSLDSQSPYGSLRIQFPCHPRLCRGHYGR